MSKQLTQAQLDKVAGLGSREAAKLLGVGKSTINDYRKLARENGGRLPVGDSATHNVIHEGAKESLETMFDGGLNVETVDSVPQSKADIDEAMVKRGFDPEQYDFSYRFSEWQAQSSRADGDGIITMYAARASATPKRTAVHAEALNVDELLTAVKEWDFTPYVTEGWASVDFTLCFADPQIGKTDVNGGTDETYTQIMRSFERAVEVCQTVRPREIIFADLGDGLENFYNTSSQRETNDLDLTSQVRLLRRLQAEGIRRLAPYAEFLTHVSIPSNHGSVRIGPQAQASTASNDWGIEVSHQLEDVFSETNFDNVSFVRPQGKHQVSVAHTTASGTTLGFTHGDQAGQQTRVAEWWQKQAFGWDNPLRDVDILLCGHFHNQAVEEVFEGRHLIFGAASDRGSAWFTNRTGRSASSGMTSFLTAERQYGDLRLL